MIPGWYIDVALALLLLGAIRQAGYYLWVRKIRMDRVRMLPADMFFYGWACLLWPILMAVILRRTVQACRIITRVKEERDEMRARYPMEDDDDQPV